MECGLALLFFSYLFLFFLISTLFSRVLSLCVRFFFSSLFLVSFLGYPVSVRQQFLELLEWEEFCPANVPSPPDISHLEFSPPTFHLLQISHILNSIRRHSTSSAYLTSGILSRRHSISSGCLTSGTLSRLHSTSSGCLTSGTLSRRHSTSSGYLTSRIMSGQTFHFLRMSHIRNSVRPTFHPLLYLLLWLGIYCF